MPKKYIKKGRPKIHWWRTGAEFKKGHSSWIKGKKGIFKQSEEFKKFMSKRMSGKNNPMFGKTREQCPVWKGERTYFCVDCGKEITRQAKKCGGCAQKGLNDGFKNHNWQAGKSFELYPQNFVRQLKDKIRVRDNFKCQLCDIPELELNRRLHIHHIDYDKRNCNETNLISLCNSCHLKTNYDREKWTKYFIEKMENKYVCNLRNGI